MSESDRPRVAIACQGGGSHTAFTAGVLDRLLAEEEVAFEVVELTGTSGGALCAFVTWFGLASEGRDEGRATARRLLGDVWDRIAAETPAERVANDLGVGVVRARSMGFPVPAFSPYDAAVSDASRELLRTILEAAVDPGALAEVVGRTDPLPPRLEIGAVDVQRGTFRTFTERDVTHDAVLASAAVPPLFRAAPVSQADGTTRWYWDGLFSQNPPLGDLYGGDDGRLDRPDELWIVRINPQREERRPRTLEAIADRRNQLAGNLSVNQELRVLRLLNQWRAEGRLDDTYRPVEVKTIDLDRTVVSPDGTLDYATKLDRSPRFLDRLHDHGRRQAERFLATERDRRHVRDAVAATWSGGAGDRADAARTALTVRLPTTLRELDAYRRGDREAPATLGDDEVGASVAAVREAIPDLTVTVEESVAEAGTVALRWRGTGTHSGRLLDVEPTGRTVTLSGLGIYHLADGRLTDARVLTGQWSLLGQVDAVEAAPLATADRVAATPVVTQLAAPAENEKVARQLVTEVWNEGRRDALERIFADDCVVHLDDGTDPTGRDAYWAFVRRYREAFPDLSVTVEETVSEGDKVVAALAVAGTHEGSFLGVAPTGERFDVDRMVIHHVDDGRIVETGVVEDTVRLLHQLGASPSAVGL